MDLIFPNVSKKIFYIFHSWEYISYRFEQDLDYTIPKGISQAKSQVYILEKEITIQVKSLQF
jgi:hypothetical protein